MKVHLLFIFLYVFNSSIYDDNVIDLIGIKNYLTGKYDASQYLQYFSTVPKEYCDKTIYLRKEVVENFIKMAEEAKKARIHINIISGFRSYNYQKGIWERKYDQAFSKSFPDKKKRFYEILKYSASPGVSRHHWGTDLDILSLDENYFNYGKGKKEKEWLDIHAQKYGFYIVYTQERTKGYNYEPWHYTYKPLSDKILPLYEKIEKNDIMGFHGDDNIINFNDFLNTYMLSINPELFKL